MHKSPKMLKPTTKNWYDCLLTVLITHIEAQWKPHDVKWNLLRLVQIMAWIYASMDEVRSGSENGLCFRVPGLDDSTINTSVKIDNRDQTAEILQMIYWNLSPWMKFVVLWIKYHWYSYPMIQLAGGHHWFRLWLDADQATNLSLNQWWLMFTE